MRFFPEPQVFDLQSKQIRKLELESAVFQISTEIWNQNFDFENDDQARRIGIRSQKLFQNTSHDSRESRLN